jgi:hypothetical protein
MDTQYLNAVTVLTAAFTTLAAVIISPLISIYVVKRQFAAQVISANRQKWINELRERIASFVTEISFLETEILPLKSDSPNTTLITKVITERSKRIHLLLSEVELYINPNEVDHAKLMDLMHEAATITHNQLATGQKTDRKYGREITNLAQTILKREWVRVKKGK